MINKLRTSLISRWTHWKQKKALSILLIATSLVALASCSSDISVLDLRTELRTNPVGVDVASPRLSWKIDANANNVQQTAYRILVAKTSDDLINNKNLIWDSGKTISDQSNYISYQGDKLNSRQQYFWKVKVWTNKGASEWSTTGSWRMAFLEADDWMAKWIGLNSITNNGEQLHDVVHTKLSARYLRKEFDLKEHIKKAYLYVCGLGLYECEINGKRVGADIFSPTATDYIKTVNYNCYDVTEHLDNQNAVGVVLGNGRYFTVRNKLHKQYGVPPAKHYGFPKLLLQLEVEYEDGSMETIFTDSSWKLSTQGPIISNNEFDGEEYDSRMEFPGWTSPGFDDNDWMFASYVDGPGGKLIAQRNPNIKTMKEIRPISIKKSGDKYIVDMGQNMVGWLKVTLNGEKDQPVNMRFAEVLNEDGSLYMANLRGAKVTNTYIPKEDGIFTWNPTFTYQGFRYAEISGVVSEPKVEKLVGQVNYDEMRTVGEFETSNPVINQIYQNAVWGIMGNYRSFPTDCPQRDERMPWLGDRATGSFAESFIFDHTLLYEKWLQDIEDAQRETGSLPDIAPSYWPFYSDNVTWPAVYIFATRMLYVQRGDRTPIQQHYTSMKKWIDYMAENYLEDHILIKDVYGDWCMPPESLELIHSKDPERITDGSLMATSFYHQLLVHMAEFAAILNKSKDLGEFNSLAEKVKAAYNKKFYNEEDGCYGNNTVTANLISLMQGLVPEENQEKVFSNIARRIETKDNSHVGVGLIGIQYLMRGLDRFGRSDLALKIASNTSYPSWGYMVENGATTIWELWNGNTANPAMNSGNHVMLLGDYLIWCYENLAGIKSDRKDVGFKKIILKPNFQVDLDYVKAKTETPFGTVRSAWSKNGKSIQWTVEIPPNSTADLYLPTGSAKNILIDGNSLENKDKYQLTDSGDELVLNNLGSGSYKLEIKR